MRPPTEAYAAAPGYGAPMDDRIRAAVAAHPDTAWAAAWNAALQLRGPVPPDAHGLLAALDAGDWAPRLRPPEAIAQRLHVVRTLGQVAADWDGDGAQAAWDAFAEAEVPPEALEHEELWAVSAIVSDEPLDDELRAALARRARAAAGLAWALEHPLADIRQALLEAEAEGAREGKRQAARRERARALRWASEPWWPELALTPWQLIPG
ncbi:MAG: hypothetical protein R3F59_21630 [Myxococcota bacterium]